MSDCTHLESIDLDGTPSSTEGCSECLRTGGCWVHLRECMTCGEVGWMTVFDSVVLTSRSHALKPSARAMAAADSINCLMTFPLECAVERITSFPVIAAPAARSSVTFTAASSFICTNEARNSSRQSFSYSAKKSSALHSRQKFLLFARLNLRYHFRSCAANCAARRARASSRVSSPRPADFFSIPPRSALAAAANHCAEVKMCCCRGGCRGAD